MKTPTFTAEQHALLAALRHNARSDRQLMLALGWGHAKLLSVGNSIREAICQEQPWAVNLRHVAKEIKEIQS